MTKNFKKIFQKIRKFRRNRRSNLNVFLVCVAIVLVWRGVWNLLDMYCFPNCPLLSNTVCIILGILILLIDDGKIDELLQD